MASINDTKFRQDMPPQGGYAKIFVQRTFPHIGKRTGRNIALVGLGFFALGYFNYRGSRNAGMRWQVEQNDVRMVMDAFMFAERDRIWLNFLRKHREEERELMKDVPGWRVGTFYGEPIFFTMPPDQWWDLHYLELWAHNSYNNQRYLEEWRIDSDWRGGPKWYDKYLPRWMERN